MPERIRALAFFKIFYVMMNRLRITLFAMLVLSPVGACIAQKIPSHREMQALKRERPDAQNYRPRESLAGACLLDKPHVVDSTLFEAVYEAEIVVDTLDPVPTRDQIVLQVGTHYFKFFSLICRQWNMNHTLAALNREQEQIGTDSRYKVVVDYAVFRDVRRHKLTNRHLLPRINNSVAEYEEMLPSFSWRTTADTCCIAGYLCYKAIGRYAGRLWTVWFAPDVPVDGGLWKFNGLPGLVLRASDERNHYAFTLKTLRKKAVPIIRYDIPTKKFTRSKYREKERELHEHPIESTGNMLYVEVDPSGKSNFYFLSDDWQIPYNPIELE